MKASEMGGFGSVVLSALRCVLNMKAIAAFVVFASVILFAQAAEAHGERTVTVQDDEVSQHRIGAPVVIHEKLPEGFTSLSIFLNVVVDRSGRVESATASDTTWAGEQWARDQAALAERSQRFKPFKRWRRPVRVKFQDCVWIVPPVEWISPRVPFPEIKDWATLRIRLNRTFCYGICPVYSIEIWGNGRVIFHGEEFVPFVGRYRGRVSRKAIADLVDAFRTADFFSLKDKYAAMITDNPSCTTSIEFDGRRKSVRDYVGLAAGMPDVVTPLERKIDQIARQEGWIR